MVYLLVITATSISLECKVFSFYYRNRAVIAATDFQPALRDNGFQIRHLQDLKLS